MNIIFMGTPDFAVPTLQMLIDEGHTICSVVTQPDRPKGRGNKQTMPAVKALALKYELPLLQPERIKNDENFYKHIKALNPDIIVVVAFGQLLPESILNIPILGCINVHGSLLPAYRGAAPIQWAIINGETKTGVTIMYMAKGMDTGDILLKKEMCITLEDTYQSLHDKMMLVGAEALKEAMPSIMAGGIEREKQDETKVTYAPVIQKSLGELDWKKEAVALEGLIRGVNPWPVAYTYYKGYPMKIWQAKVVEDEADEEAGTILEVAKEGLYVQTAKGQLLIEEIQMPNKKRMPIVEYIKGNSIEQGYKLGE